MKLFPQLALVSAIAISGNAMAMQALDDATLSDATGQEGITITITPAGGGISIDQLVVRDVDGLGSSTTPVAGLSGNSGAITLGNAATDFRIDTTGIDVVIDADGNGASPVLNVGIKLNGASITTGDIGVAVGDASTSAVTRKATTVTVLDSMNIALGTTNLNVQLGNEAQGAMIKVSATIAGGLLINNFALKDTGGVTAKSGGAISIGTISVTDAPTLATPNPTGLTVNSDIDVNATGLVLTNNGGAVDVVLDNVKLGSNAVGNTTPTLGDVGLFGLNMTGTTITISGH